MERSVIDRIDVTEVRTDDIVVVKVKRALSESSRKAICEALSSRFPKNKILILSESVEIKIIRPIDDKYPASVPLI